MDDGGADQGGMGDGNDVTLIALSLEPASDSVNQLQDGFTAMRSGCGVCQPCSQTFRVLRLNIVEIQTAPASVVAVAQLSGDFRRQPQRPRSLPGAMLGA